MVLNNNGFILPNIKGKQFYCESPSETLSHNSLFQGKHTHRHTHTDTHTRRHTHTHTDTHAHTETRNDKKTARERSKPKI